MSETAQIAVCQRHVKSSNNTRLSRRVPARRSKNRRVPTTFPARCVLLLYPKHNIAKHRLQVARDVVRHQVPNEFEYSIASVSFLLRVAVASDVARVKAHGKMCLGEHKMPFSHHDPSLSSSTDAQTQPLSADAAQPHAAQPRTTTLLSPSRSLNPRVKYGVAMIVGAVAALSLSTLASSLTQRWTAPDRISIVEVGGAKLVRQETLREEALRQEALREQQATRSSSAFPASSTRTAPRDDAPASVSDNLWPDNDLLMQNIPPQQRQHLQARRDEERNLAERQRLEDQKRLIERQLEDQQIREKRLQEDKLFAQQRAQEEKQRQEQYAREDIQEQQNPAPATPSLTSSQ
jgi:hypothetical protein